MNFLNKKWKTETKKKMNFSNMYHYRTSGGSNRAESINHSGFNANLFQNVVSISPPRDVTGFFSGTISPEVSPPYSSEMNTLAVSIPS